MKTKRQKFRMYEVDQDYINFLRGEGRFAYRLDNEVDKQVYSRYGMQKENIDKVFGIVFQFDDIKMFVPITHDGNKSWLNREDKCDIEKIYNSTNEYVGALLLCKAICISDNVISFFDFAKNKSLKRFTHLGLCYAELNYLNRSSIYEKIHKKLLMCIKNEPSQIMDYRVNYDLSFQNLVKYVNLIESEKQKETNDSNN